MEGSLGPQIRNEHFPGLNGDGFFLQKSLSELRASA
jgi:hypothetical protein